MIRSKWILIPLRLTIRCESAQVQRDMCGRRIKNLLLSRRQ